MHLWKIGAVRGISLQDFAGPTFHPPPIASDLVVIAVVYGSAKECSVVSYGFAKFPLKVQLLAAHPECMILADHLKHYGFVRGARGATCPNSLTLSSHDVYYAAGQDK